MTNVIGNVVAARPKTTGGAYRAPEGSTLPTDSSSALDAAFKALGFVGDAGITETNGRTTTTVKAWGNEIVKALQTDFTVSYQLTLIEALSEEVNKAIFGDDNVTATAAGASHGNQLAISVKADPLDREAWAFEIQDGDATLRLVIPEGQVTAVGDISYNDGVIIAYPVTIQAFPDSNGVHALKYTDDGQLTG